MTHATSSHMSQAGETPRRERLVIFAALVLVLLLASLDQTIVSTALPTIVREIGGLAHLSWIVTAYLLATTVVIPLYGKLGDLFGRRIVLQTAVVIFLAGSMLCGLAQNLPELIVFRVLQGLGGGGLIVTSMAVIADIIPPRDRGRYQGFIGGVFGFSTVLGPVLGGYIVEHLTWRWIFYINLPLGLLALAVINRSFKVQHRPAKVHIDFAGAGLLALTLLGVVLASSLGETLYRSAPVSLFALLLFSAVTFAGFVHVERTVSDPVVPLSLFSNRTFTVAICVGFIVGMALFGSITLLPVYLQVVKGLDPSHAGLVMTPMMLGVLTTSITSGQIISRTGRYKVFPVSGTAIMATALFQLSYLGVDTSPTACSGYMLLLGCGLGMVMQVLVMAVQNSVPYEMLGVATSGTTLFRSIGGSVGTAIFGGIFAYVLESSLRTAVPGAAADILDPAMIAALSDAERSAYLSLFVNALHPVFRMASVLAFIGFLMTFALEERPLRKSMTPDATSDLLHLPRDATSLAELERIIIRFSTRENRWLVYQRVAAMDGIKLEPDELWLLARLAENGSRDTVTGLVGRLDIDEGYCRALVDRLAAAGMANGTHDAIEVTGPGFDVFGKLVARREGDLQKMTADWDRNELPELRVLLAELARTFAAAPPIKPAMGLGIRGGVSSQGGPL